jgi:hypothetical protein
MCVCVDVSEQRDETTWDGDAPFSGRHRTATLTLVVVASAMGAPEAAVAHDRRAMSDE